MQQTDARSNQDPYFAEEMAQLVAKLRALSPDEGPYRQLVEQISAEIQDQSDLQDYDATRQILEAHFLSVQQFNEALNETLSLLLELETVHQRREKYSPRWWELINTSLESAFIEDPESATLQWMATYVEALLDWELPACERLASSSFPFPDTQLPYILQIRMGDQAVQSGDYPRGLPMLENLLERVSALTKPARRSQASTLAIFIGRIFQYKQNDNENAAVLYQRAADLAPGDGRPLAAQAILMMNGDESDWNQANQLLSEALELSPDKPDAYVAKALLMETRSQWEEADIWYQKAIQPALNEPNLITALGKLIAPGSGRLYLHAAGQLVQSGDLAAALQAVRKAQQLSFQDDTRYPFRGAMALEADILLELAEGEPQAEEKTEIATLYLEAGKHYYWSKEYASAIEQFRNAEKLHPSQPEIYWYLADTLRVANFINKPPYYDNVNQAWESLDIWNKGMQLSTELPKNESWAYLVRADIAQMLSALPDQDSSAHRWQGLLACEQSLLVNSSRGRAWSMLSRELNNQKLFHNASTAIRAALDLDKNNLSNLIEYLSLLINTGDFEQAEQVYDQVTSHPSISESDKLYYLSYIAMIDYYQGKYPEALGNLNRALEKNPEDLWMLSMRREIYRNQGDLENARQDSEWIWEQRNNPKYPANTYTFDMATAALHLGSFSEAIDRIAPKLQSASDRQTAHLITGMSYLGLGNLDQADLHLEQAVKLANDPRSLIDLTNDLALSEARAHRDGWAHADQVIEWINRPGGPKDQAWEKRQALKSDAASPWREYRNVLTDADLGQEGSLSWLGSQAGLGRLNLDAGELPDARDAYLALMPYADKFREVHLGIRQTGAAWLEQARAQVRSQEYSQAVLSLQSLRDEPRLLPETAAWAELESLQFLVDLGLGRIELAETSLLRALHSFQEIQPPAAGTQLAGALKANLPDIEVYWQVDALLRGLPSEPQDQAAIAQVQEELGPYVEEYLAVNQTSDEAKYPLVANIVVEIGELLAPTVSDEDWPVIQTYMPEMRERIRSQMGVKLPGVRFRDPAWGKPSAHHFQILLEEQVVAKATISPGRWFMFSPSGIPPATQRWLDVGDRLGTLEVAAPLIPGYWIDPKLGALLQSGFGDALQKYGIEIWQDPAQYLIHYLEAVLRRKLSLFLGYQEIIDLLESLKDDPVDDLIIEKVLPNPLANVRLWRLLRRLLDGQVSITPLKEILLSLQEHGLIQDDVHNDLIEVRQRIKAYLPGNLPGDRTLPIEPALEENLRRLLDNQDGKHFLAVPRKDVLTLIDDFNAQNAQHDPEIQAVLVVSDEELLPFFQKFLQLIPSDYLVIAKSELLTTSNPAEPSSNPQKS